LLSVLEFLAGVLTSCEADRFAGLDGGHSRVEAVEGTSLGPVLRAYQRKNLRPGILFVISDFLDEGDFRTEMKLLAHRGFDLNLIQVLAPEELRPELVGDLMLIDSETAEAREIAINQRVLAAYRKTLSRFTESLEQFSRAHGIGYIMITAEDAFEDLLFKNLIESRIAE
jgi:hypothetical protein